MKKIILSFVISIFLISVSAVSSFAAWSQTGGPGGTMTLGGTNTTTVGLSAGVYAGYSGTTTAYGAGTVNEQGDKTFGASSASSQVYYQSVAVGTTSPTEVTAGQSTWTSAWTEVGK